MGITEMAATARKSNMRIRWPAIIKKEKWSKRITGQKGVAVEL
jgi:hypothetical protein